MGHVDILGAQHHHLAYEIDGQPITAVPRKSAPKYRKIDWHTFRLKETSVPPNLAVTDKTSELRKGSVPGNTNAVRLEISGRHQPFEEDIVIISTVTGQRSICHVVLRAPAQNDGTAKNDGDFTVVGGRGSRTSNVALRGAGGVIHSDAWEIFRTVMLACIGVLMVYLAYRFHGSGGGGGDSNGGGFASPGNGGGYNNYSASPSSPVFSSFKGKAGQRVLASSPSVFAAVAPSPVRPSEMDKVPVYKRIPRSLAAHV